MRSDLFILVVFVHLGDKRDRHGAKTGSFILELQQEISTELWKNVFQASRLEDHNCFPQGKYLRPGGSLAFHEPPRNIDNLDEKQTIIQECAPYRYLIFYNCMLMMTRIIIQQGAHKCVYSATDEVPDSLYTEASKRVYRFMHFFALLCLFFFTSFFSPIFK